MRTGKISLYLPAGRRYREWMHEAAHSSQAVTLTVADKTILLYCTEAIGELDGLKMAFVDPDADTAWPEEPPAWQVIA